MKTKLKVWLKPFFNWLYEEVLVYEAIMPTVDGYICNINVLGDPSVQIPFLSPIRPVKGKRFFLRLYCK